MLSTTVSGFLRATLVAGALTCLAGCAIDVDLTSSPPTASVGDPVTFDISVTNRTTCPVGGVVALLVPFVPKDLFISQIQDEEVREALSTFVDAFCSGADVQPPDGSGNCRIEDGDLICDLIPPTSLSAGLPQTAVAMTDDGERITCGSDGAKFTCRVPRLLVEQAMAQQATSEASLGALQCATNGDFATCGALLLDPAETKSAQVELNVPRAGTLRNWVVSFATVRGGVCTGGLLKRRPCEDNAGCSPTAGTCGSGICVGGTRAGFGCDMTSQCTGGGTCTDCELPDDGQLLSGVACTTTAAPVSKAPAASAWGLAAVIAALALAGTTMLRRRHRAGDISGHAT